MRRVRVPKDFLIKHYVGKEKSAQVIADEVGVTRQTIINRLREYGIEVRPSNYVRRENIKIKKETPEFDYKDKDTFSQVYNKLRTLGEVSKFFNISYDTAYNWKNRHQLETVKGMSFKVKESINEGKPYADKDNLEAMYSKYSTYELGEMWNCSPSTIQIWLKRLNIKARNSKEEWKRKPKSKSKLVGFGEEGYDLNYYREHYEVGNRPLSTRVAESIKELVGECQACGEGEVLDLHHIDENNLNNLPDNHAVLCPNCHAKIHRLGRTMEELIIDFKPWNTYV